MPPHDFFAKIMQFGAFSLHIPSKKLLRQKTEKYIFMAKQVIPCRLLEKNVP